MKALVVGASGHLGAHLVRALLSHGIETRALVRHSSDVSALTGQTIDIVRGDVLDRESLRRAFTGCTHAYNLAAPTGLEADSAKIIVDGTKTFIEEAQRAQIERVVLTSSTAAIGYSDDPSVVLDESSAQKTFATPYHSAKWEAERLAFDYAETTGLAVVIVNPSSILGSLDFRVTPSNAPIQRCLDGGLPLAFQGGITVVHAADVARGHLLAMERGIPGQRYILGGDRLNIPDYFRLIAHICGKRGPALVAPRFAMLGAGLGFDLLHAAGVRQVPFTFGQIRNIVGRYAWYSSEKARSTLSYKWRPAAQAIEDYVTWVKADRPVLACIEDGDQS